jgi:outer membrane protein assembly factor BamB
MVLRGGRALVFGALLAFPLVAADWLQEGYDASQTGHVAGALPAWPDVAWVTQLNGSNSAYTGGYAGPLVIDGAIYVVTGDYGLRDELDVSGIHRLETETGAATLIAGLPSFPFSYGSDGQRIFVVLGREVRAFNLDGSEAWRYPFPPIAAGGLGAGTDGLDRLVWCGTPSVQPGARLLLACTERIREEVVPGEEELPLVGDYPGNNAFRSPFVVSIDPGTGVAQWLWRKGGPDELTRPLSPEVPATGQANPVGTSMTGAIMVRVVAAGDFAVVTAQEVLGGGALEWTLWGLDIETGEPVWARASSFAPERTDNDYAEERWVWYGMGLPTASPEAVYVRFEQVHALNPAQGNVFWSRPLGQEDQQHTDAFPSTGMGLRPDALFSTSYQTVYRQSLRDGEVEWIRPLPGDGTLRGSPLIVADDTLLATVGYGSPYLSTSQTEPVLGPPSDEQGRRTFHSIAIATGEVVWTLDLNETPSPDGRSFDVGAAPFVASYADGRLIIGGSDGTVRLIGHTSASMDVEIDANAKYPKVGSEVRVDLGRTSPGLQGDATMFRAHWGDGSTSAWQQSPSFTHSYAAAGDVVARFEAANEAGQSSSETVTFHVGGSPPTILETWFARENQDVTFFVLGLAITLLGALLGLAGAARHRRRLARELHDLEAVYAATQDRPLDCEAALAERKAHARTLLLRRRLTENDYNVLAARIDELSLGTRHKTLKSDLAFLPYSIHESLRQLLSDGRVTRWERDHFAAALKQDRLLSREQKAAVMRQVDQWLKQDSSA